MNSQKYSTLRKLLFVPNVVKNVLTNSYRFADRQVRLIEKKQALETSLIFFSCLGVIYCASIIATLKWYAVGIAFFAFVFAWFVLYHFLQGVRERATRKYSASRLESYNTGGRF